MFSSLLFGGLSRSAGETGADDVMSRPSSSPSGARLSAVLAMHDAEAANRSPILRPSATADNKLTLAPSDSVVSFGSKIIKSPLLDTPVAVGDENRAPISADTSVDRSMEDVFHTPIVAASSDVSLKFAEPSVSGLSQSVRAKKNTIDVEIAEPDSLQVCRGQIEPLGVPVPSTYADAANLATQYPDVAENILALPLSPKKNMPPTDLAKFDAVVEDGQSTSTSDTFSPAKIQKDAHTPAKPNWALAPKSSPMDSHDKRDNRRRRGGKTKEVAKDSELRHRQSKGRGQPRGAPKGRDIEGDMKSISPSTNKDKTRARTNGPHSTRQSRAHSTSDARSSRVGTPSNIVRDRPRQDNLSSEADTRSTLHLAQVDALIKELQKSRGLTERSGSGQRTPNSTKLTPIRASSVPSAADMPQNQLVWIAGHDGVLRPGFGEQIESSRLPPSSSPSVFLPAGARVVHSHPMRRDVNPFIDSAPGYPSRVSPGPRRSPEPRPFQDSSTSFPAAFHGANNRPLDMKGTMNRTVRCGRTPSSQATNSRLTEGGPRNWRSAKLSKNPSPASTRGPSPSPISRSQPDFGQGQRWPTLEEICAMKSAP